MSKCCVFGLGYIGLPTAALIATNGHKVIGVDIKEEIIELVNNGSVHFTEKDLDKLVKKAVESGNLVAKNYPEKSDIFIIAVPTPIEENENQELPSPNIKYVLKAVESISKVFCPGNLIIIESTSPVGTSEIVLNLIKEKLSLKNEEVNVAYCPERVLPGRIIEELVNNDRVIGGLNDESISLAKELFSGFCKGNLFSTNSRTAELVKLTENSFRDVNIAFANELSLICQETKVEVKELIRLANRHPRVNILSPSCGVGGHCIPIDPWFIASQYPNSTPLIQTARAVNENKMHWTALQIIDKATSLKKKLGRSPTIGCFGLAYKPNVDDLRESPAIKIIEQLIENKLKTIVCEPNITKHESIKIDTIEYVFNNSDLLVFLVSHKPFFKLNLKGKEVYDACGFTENK